VITPTYRRPEEMAEMTRLAQTLALSEGPVHWIVAVDSSQCDAAVESFLSRVFGHGPSSLNSLVRYTLISAPMPLRFRDPERVKRFGLPRGVAGRRAALKWLKRHLK